MDFIFCFGKKFSKQIRPRSCYLKRNLNLVLLREGKELMFTVPRRNEDVEGIIIPSLRKVESFDHLSTLTAFGCHKVLRRGVEGFSFYNNLN